ncbi:MAG: glycerol dehydrogenase [Desulfuromonadales bacterium]
MDRAFLSPGKYIQGAGVISGIGQQAAKFGSRALAIGGKTALSMCGADIVGSLAQHKLACGQEIFGGISSRSEIDRLTKAALANGADLIIVVGGGMSIDAGKVVAHEMKAPVIVVPTIATTNAPCSAMSVIYTDSGDLVEYLPLIRNPDCVLVDTRYIAQSPARFLVAGMGDALATYWEADTCIRGGLAKGETGTTAPTHAAMAMARLTYEILLESGLQARLAVERKMVTPALEAIVEANTLTSGLGFENLGHAGAHSIHNGLLAAHSSDRKMHGEIVAFGLLAQLVMEGRPAATIREVQGFCDSVGLPLSLAELGIINPVPAEIRKVAEVACAEGESIHATWFPVTVEEVEAAIWTADALGCHYRENARSRQV